MGGRPPASSRDGEGQRLDGHDAGAARQLLEELHEDRLDDASRFLPGARTSDHEGRDRAVQMLEESVERLAITAKQPACEVVVLGHWGALSFAEPMTDPRRHEGWDWPLRRAERRDEIPMTIP